MNEWWQSIKNNLHHHFVKDVAILQIGTGFSTGLAFISSLVMARVFQPELYGQYLLIFSLVGTFSLFMNWGEDAASATLMSEAYQRQDRQAVLKIICYYLKVAGFIFITLGFVGILISPLLGDLIYHDQSLGQWARIIFINNFILIGFTFLMLIFQISRQMKKYAILENLNQFFTSLAIILAVVVGLGIWGAVYAQLFSAIIMLILSVVWYSHFQKTNLILPKWSEIFKELFKVKIGGYFKFGFQIAVDKNLVNLRTLLPTMLMGYFAIPAEVAFYRIAYSYVSLTMLLISPISNLLTVQFPKTKTYGNAALRRRFTQTMMVGGVISVYLTLAFVILAPGLVKFFYGADYLPTLPVVYIFAGHFALTGFSLGFGPILRTINKMKQAIYINGLTFLILLYPAVLLIKAWGGLGAAVWLVGINFITRIINFFVINYFLKNAEASNN